LVEVATVPWHTDAEAREARVVLCTREAIFAANPVEGELRAAAVAGLIADAQITGTSVVANPLGATTDACAACVFDGAVEAVVTGDAVRDGDLFTAAGIVVTDAHHAALVQGATIGAITDAFTSFAVIAFGAKESVVTGLTLGLEVRDTGPGVRVA